MSEMQEFHDELRAVARELLGKAGAEVEWRQFSDAGWTSLEVPEELGGAGASFVETAIVLEELGRGAVRSRLLGTVLGMIEAFQAMKDAGGNTSPDQLAGGISTALTHTFLGLMLAVPCLAAFGVLRTIVDRLTVRGALIAEELLLLMRPTDARAAAAPGQATPMQQRATLAGFDPRAVDAAGLPELPTSEQGAA